ncbi:hypothetical protein Tco_1383168 [Tanacetum coccineum]
MNPIATQLATLDNALVPSEKRLKIERCNARIAFSKPQRDETYQVTLEALKISHCYLAFVITAKVPQIYMHQFWNTITKIRDTDAYSFKLDKKKCRVDTKVFREILQICPKILNQNFITPPSEEDLVTFIQELGYSSRCASLGKQHDLIDSGSYELKSFGDKTMSMRTRINLHIIRDDSLLDIKDSQAYKTYYDFATGKVPPRKARKYKKAASPPRKMSPVKEAEPTKKAKRVKRLAKKSTSMPTAGVAIRDTPSASVSKKKTPTKAYRSKGIEILSDVSLSEAAQLKEATKRSKKDYHISQASGSGDGTDFESGVPDEQHCKTSDTDEGTGTKPWVPDKQQRKTPGTNEGTGTIPGVLDVPTYDSESENESWGDSEDDNDDDNDDNSKDDDDKADSDDDGNSDADDNERTDSDDDENPSFTLKDYDEEEHDEEYESDDDYENTFKEEDDDDLYKDVDVRSLGT